MPKTRGNILVFIHCNTFVNYASVELEHLAYIKYVLTSGSKPNLLHCAQGELTLF